ncbi:MAG: aminoacyl-tRNA hydrolase [Coriobacteriales bacterium]|jgi:PTH1 family peptidyl-tRNA hydrolase|nr:aminoacyl-tRNA hydrolase [Coriobacteriales bacterium]
MSLFHRQSDVELLIVGLGNPGEEYAATRHNIGFMTVDLLAERAGVRSWKSRCSALTAVGRLGGRAVALAKPQTYMNRSGGAVKGLLRHFDLPADVLVVIHDDLDIPEHLLRLKNGGGHGGHNGLRDINAAVGEDYRRVRVGIGRPPGRMPADRFVLQRLSGQALEELGVDAQAAAGVVQQIVEQGFTAVQNSVNADAGKG